MHETFSQKNFIRILFIVMTLSLLFAGTQTFAHDYSDLPAHTGHKIEQRLEQHRERIEERKRKFQVRICDHLGRIQDRYDRKGYPFSISFPSFCDGDPDPEQPPIVDIGADPMEIALGEMTTISWDSSFAENCEGSDGLEGDLAVSGDIEKMPTETTTYTVTCMNEDGEDSNSVTVTVTDLQIDPPSLLFEAGPENIEVGEFSTLSWDSADADSCTASDGSGDWPGDKSLDGSEEVSPTEDTTYTLTCSNDGGDTEQSVMVNVIPANPPTLALEAEPTEIMEGEESDLSWLATGADSCTASNGWIGLRDESGDETVSPLVTTTYTLTCENEKGSTEKSATVTVIPAPEELDHVVISEVYYDVDDTHGEENTNEWIELYNPTDVAIDLLNWSLSDTSVEITIAVSTSIEAGGYLVITNGTSTAGFWTIPAETPVLALQTAINTGGLSNTGDVLFLNDPDDTVIDSVSWGNNVSAFDPAVADVAEGHSIEREDLGEDNDDATDWIDNGAPSPGE